MDQAEQDQRERRRPRAATWWRLARWALFAIVLVFVGRLLIRQIAAEDWSKIHFTPIYLVLAFLSALAARGMVVLSYRGVLAGFGVRPRWLQSMTIAWLPLAGKYIPGKFASVAGAVWLLRRNNVKTAPAVSAVFIINGLLVMVGLIVAGPLTLWAPVRRVLPQAWLWCSLVLAGGIVCLHPRVFALVGNFVLRKLKRPQFSLLPDLRHYVAPILVMLLQCASSGVAMWLLARSITEVSPLDIPLFISATALASTLGFLAVFAPAGIGVREGILLAVLSPTLLAGAGTAIVAFRILHLLVELLLILTALGLLKTHLPARPGSEGAQSAAATPDLTPKANGD